MEVKANFKRNSAMILVAMTAMFIMGLGADVEALPFFLGKTRTIKGNQNKQVVIEVDKTLKSKPGSLTTFNHFPKGRSFKKGRPLLFNDWGVLDLKGNVEFSGNKEMSTSLYYNVVGDAVFGGLVAFRHNIVKKEGESIKQSVFGGIIDNRNGNMIFDKNAVFEVNKIKANEYIYGGVLHNEFLNNRFDSDDKIDGKITFYADVDFNDNEVESVERDVYGGVACNEGGNINFNRNVFLLRNNAKSKKFLLGGVLHNRSDGSGRAEIRFNRLVKFIGNAAESDDRVLGGAIYNEKGDIIFNGPSQFLYNSPHGQNNTQGGAIYNSSGNIAFNLNAFRLDKSNVVIFGGNKIKSNGVECLNDIYNAKGGTININSLIDDGEFILGGGIDGDGTGKINIGGPVKIKLGTGSIEKQESFELTYKPTIFLNVVKFDAKTNEIDRLSRGGEGGFINVEKISGSIILDPKILSSTLEDPYRLDEIFEYKYLCAENMSDFKAELANKIVKSEDGKNSCDVSFKKDEGGKINYGVLIFKTIVNDIPSEEEDL